MRQFTRPARPISVALLSGWLPLCALGLSPLYSALGDYAYVASGNRTYSHSRLATRERKLMISSNGTETPLLVRGVTYSPVPIGRNQHSDALRVADFFTPSNSPVWQRDLPMMRLAGMNSVRVYELSATGDHMAFLDECYRLNITVFAGFHLDESLNLASQTAAGTAIFNPLDVNLADTKENLRSAVQRNRHPAVGMWLVGNEVNLEANRFVCGSTPACAGADCYALCKFQDNTELAYQVINELCAVVEEEGYPCTSPLADVPLPFERYGLEPYAPFSASDFAAHVRLLDNRMTHFCCWMANIYRGTTFGSAFHDYAKVSGKPLLIGEYGIDAYNSAPSVAAEDQAAHAAGIVNLVEELERHAISCRANCARDGLCLSYSSAPPFCTQEFGTDCTSWECQTAGSLAAGGEAGVRCRQYVCPTAGDGVCNDGGPGSEFATCPYGTDCEDCGPRDDNVVSGGFLMSWVDELWKGDRSCGPDTGPSNGFCGRYCPDHGPDGPYLQRPCGGRMSTFPDGFLNEEWWGLLAPRQACGARAGVDPDRLSPRTAFHEIRLRWGFLTDGTSSAGCSAFDAIGNGGSQLLERTDALGLRSASFETQQNVSRCGARMALERLKARVCETARLAGFPRNNGQPSAPDRACFASSLPSTAADCEWMEYLYLRDQAEINRMANWSGWSAAVSTFEYSACPQPSPHMSYLESSPEGTTRHNQSLLALSRDEGVLPVPCDAVCNSYPFECRAFNVSNYPRLMRNRLHPQGNGLVLNGRPFFVRAVCYSPVPVGHDPGYSEPWGDYFTAEWVEVFTRDVALFVEMGANAIRLYTFKTSQRHRFFLDVSC